MRLLWWRRGGGSPQDLSTVRETLARARDLLAEVVKSGGKNARWFLDEQRRYTPDRLRHVARLTNDNWLGARLEGVAIAWEVAYSQSPGAKAATPSEEEAAAAAGRKTPYQKQRAEKMKDVVSAAKEGLVEAEAALDRLDDMLADPRRR